MRTFNLPASAAGLSELVLHVVKFAEEVGFSARQSYLLRLAAEEIVGNVLAHGCPEDIGETITVVLDDRTDQIRLVVIDSAAPFDPSQLTCEPGPPGALEKGQLGGLGLLLVGRLIGDIRYRRRAGQNETTIMFDREIP